MKKYCPACKSKIIDKKCECSIWLDENDKLPWYASYLAPIFDHLETSKEDDRIIYGAHQKGWGIIFFKGSWEDMEEVKKSIDEVRKE